MPTNTNGICWVYDPVRVWVHTERMPRIGCKRSAHIKNKPNVLVVYIDRRQDPCPGNLGKAANSCRGPSLANIFCFAALGPMGRSFQGKRFSRATHRRRRCKRRGWPECMPPGRTRRPDSGPQMLLHGFQKLGMPSDMGVARPINNWAVPIQSFVLMPEGSCSGVPLRITDGFGIQTSQQPCSLGDQMSSLGKCKGNHLLGLVLRQASGFHF